MKKSLLVVGLFVCALALGACKKQVAEAPVEEQQMEQPQAPAAETAQPEAAQ